jgi:hypothetical protein
LKVATKILLAEWAARRYNPPPPIFTLRKWARDGEVPPNLLRGEIGTIDCGFRILPLVPVDPEPKPA